MIKQCLDVTKGYLIWSAVRLRENVDNKKVVLVLTGENDKVDDYALRYLDHVIERKYADEALVIAPDRGMAEKVFRYDYSHRVKVKVLPMKKIALIYKWYCLDKLFFKNLIFTYIRTTSDNLLGRIMDETDIDEEDVVCLALYNLRTIPGKKKV